MKDLIILGAGGMGHQLYFLASCCEGYGRGFIIKGFLDDNPSALDDFEGYPPIIGSIESYEIQPQDVFANSIGDVQKKRKCIKTIQDKGGEFMTLVHPCAGISQNVRIGMGCIIAANAYIGVDSTIGDFSFIQNGAIVGHDVKIGNWCRIDCHAVCIAGVELGDAVCIHTAAVINHNIKIASGACVGAGSFVIRNIKNAITVYGNPARKIDIK